MTATAELERALSGEQTTPLWAPWDDAKITTARIAHPNLERDVQRGVRLGRIQKFCEMLDGLWNRGAAHQRLVEQILPTAIADVLWAAAVPDALSFGQMDRLNVARLAAETAGAISGFARQFGHSVLAELIRVGFRFVDHVSESHQQATDQVRSHLYHNYPVRGVERWWELDPRHGPRTLRTLLAKFTVADAYAVRAGGTIGRRESLGQTLRQMVYLLDASRLREARNLFAQSTEVLDRSDPFQVENYLVHSAIFFRRLGRLRDAGEALLERHHVLTTHFSERMEHKEAGNTFFLGELCPNWVTGADYARAFWQDQRAGIRYDIASNNAAEAARVRSRLPDTVDRFEERERWDTVSLILPDYYDILEIVANNAADRESRQNRSQERRATSRHFVSSILNTGLGRGGAVGGMPPPTDVLRERMERDRTEKQSGETDLKSARLPAVPSVAASELLSFWDSLPPVAMLHERMQAARARSGLSEKQVGVLMGMAEGSARQNVSNLLRRNDPGIYELTRFARVVQTPLSQLLDAQRHARLGSIPGQVRQFPPPPPVAMLHERMQAARARSGLSEKQVGVLMGMAEGSARQNVSNLLRRNDPGIYELTRFARVVQTPLSQLLTHS